MDETVIPKSPNAAGLDKLDQTPIELATGGTNISYSLYNIKTKSINVPIELRYHSGGIKVDEISSWVGLGWSLDVAGLISRTINGNPDEGIFINKNKQYYLYSSTLGAINPYHGTWGYDTSNAARTHFIDIYRSRKWDYGTIVVLKDYTDQMYQLAGQTGYWGGYDAKYLNAGLQQYPSPYQDVQTTNADPNAPALPSADGIYTSNLVDPQPDEFSLRIPGYSGKFLFNNLGIPQLNPVNKDLKISFIAYQNNNDSTVAPYIDTWMVSTTDGKQYYFGYDASAKTNADGSTGSRSPYFFSPTTEWYLTKMVDVNTKDSIVFSYKHLRVATGRQLHQYIFPNSCSALGTSGGGIYESGETKTNFAINCTATILTKITTTKEVVNFYSNFSSLQLNGEPAKLDSITVTDVSTGLVAQRFTLNYDFFKMSQKLKLVSFQKQSMDQVNMPTSTQFSYYDTIVNSAVFQNRYDSTKNDTVQYTSLAQDYWGYYNNAHQNYDGFMVYPASCSVLVSRKAAWPFMQLGVLNKITSPTGGQIVYEYEPHTASTFYDNMGNLSNLEEGQFVDNPFPLDTIGGLRIKKITLIDSIGRTKSIRQFSYANVDGSSSGHLNITPSVTQRIEQPLCFTSPGTTDYILISNFNRTPIHQNSAIVNYSRVKEISLDSLGNMNGYSISTFYNDWNMPDTSYLSYTSLSPASAYRFNGLGNMPLWQSHHSKGVNLLNGYEISQEVYSSDNRLLQTHKNTYSVKQYSGFFVGFNLFAQSLDGPCAAIPHAPIDYNNYYTVMHSDTTPNPCVPLSHTYYYLRYYAEYPKSVFLSKAVDVNYTMMGDSMVNVQQHYYESPSHLNTTRSVNYNSKGDTVTTVQAYAFDFADNIGGDTTIKQMKTSYYNPLICTSNFQGQQISSSKITTYKNFGSSGNPAIYPDTTYIHHANALSAPLNTYGMNNVISYPVTTYFADNYYLPEVSYIFTANGNLSEQRKTAEPSTAYIWDYNGSLPIAEVKNASASEIAYTSFEADGSGGWTINSPVRDSVTAAFTGKKSYSLGNGSISKSGLISTNVYRITYWTKNTSAYSISGTQTGYPIQGRTINGWTFFEHRISGQSTITLSGINAIDELRLYPDASQMTTLTYSPLVGVTSQCDINNRATYYEYDGLQRLSIVRDQDMNIVKTICYNYTGQPENCSNNLYYNLALSQSFSKNNCGAGYVGGAVVYTVPLGKYTAATPLAANQLAQNEINVNGQAYANANGSCTILYGNVAKSGTFSRNNCSTGFIGTSVTYTVPANTYTSTVSQANADQQAQNDVNSNGQAYANTNGACVSNITITSENFAGVSGFTVQFVNTNTAQLYSFTIQASGGTLGTIPSGNYNVTISKPGNTTQYYLAIGGNAVDGDSSATFNNITIDNTCNTVTIDFIE
jgi:hypothetical protein